MRFSGSSAIFLRLSASPPFSSQQQVNEKREGENSQETGNFSTACPYLWVLKRR